MNGVRSLIAATLVAIYAVATFGYDLSVTLCHCNQSEHVRLHHSHDCHDCCHTSANDGISSSKCCNCSHDHSTDIDIYDKTRIVNILIEPHACDAVIPQIFSPQSLAKLFRESYNSNEAEQLPDMPDIACRALRAPPVMA